MNNEGKEKLILKLFEIYVNYKDFLRYFLIVCPHRISNEIIVTLDI